MSIMGNVAGLGAVQPDWAQTDEKRADFIRNFYPLVLIILKPEITFSLTDIFPVTR